MENKMFLENLPKWEISEGSGVPGTINWKKTVGYKVKCIYDNEFYEIEIIGYSLNKKRYLTLKWKNEVKDISANNFIYCGIGELIGKRTPRFKYKIGDEFNDDKRNMTLTDALFINGRKNYRYTCNICGWNNGYITEYTLLKNGGCSCCRGLTVVEGINDLATLRPDLVKYFKNPNEAKQVTVSSNKSMELICPRCNSERKMYINNMNKTGFICNKCSDGISMPEKVMINMLKQLNLEFETQYSPRWCGRKRYDFYIPSLNVIIETHGEQHYINKTAFSFSLKEIQENDKLKKELALINGIQEENYVVIDCRHSDLEWIERNIKDSILSKLLNITHIDFKSIFSISTNSNLKIESMNLWNKGVSIKDISNMLGVSIDTVRIYLKFWASLGKCNYNAKLEIEKNNYTNGRRLVELFSKPIEMYKDGIYIGTFKSAVDLESKSKELFGEELRQSGIRKVAAGTKKHYKGYTFKYK